MLVSLHLPKTAGTSFLGLLESHYGEKLLRDYGDRPLNRSPWQRRLRAVRGCARNAVSSSRFSGFECIHGHFMPLKYRFMPGNDETQFVAWLRDPVERLASHYYYWKRSYNPMDAGRLHRRVVEDRWSLERFCLGPELQNTYSKFLWACSLESFNFIGITEHYNEDVESFSALFLGTTPPQVAAENVNQSRERGDQQRSDRYIDDGEFRSRVERHHGDDVALYRRALEMRARRQRMAGQGDSGIAV
ncbi:MAG: hypothetical protein AAF098_11900 [Pseudomonadota bacterium]